jgi:hypothetical protein
MSMKSPTLLALTTAILILALGCASRSERTSGAAAPGTTTGSVAASPTTPDLTGTWRGNAGVGARSTSVALDLRQAGEALKGNLEVGGRPDLSGPVTGKVEGDTLRLRLDSGAVGPQVRVKGDTMTGMISGEPLDMRRVR